MLTEVRLSLNIFHRVTSYVEKTTVPKNGKHSVEKSCIHKRVPGSHFTGEEIAAVILSVNLPLQDCIRAITSRRMPNKDTIV